MAAGTLRDAGAIKYLDFRIYFAIIKVALADTFRELIKTQRLKAVAFCHFGGTTLCRFLGGLGDLGWKWVDIGGRGGGRNEIAKIAMISKIAEIEKQGLTKTIAYFRLSENGGI
jgi:hypothetical protein